MSCSEILKANKKAWKELAPANIRMHSMTRQSLRDKSDCMRQDGSLLGIIFFE